MCTKAQVPYRPVSIKSRAQTLSLLWNPDVLPRYITLQFNSSLKASGTPRQRRSFSVSDVFFCWWIKKLMAWLLTGQAVVYLACTCVCLWVWDRKWAHSCLCQIFVMCVSPCCRACVCVSPCVCVLGFCYLFRTFSGINSDHMRTSSPHGDQRPVLIWHDLIFEVFSLWVRYELRLG